MNYIIVKSVLGRQDATIQNGNMGSNLYLVHFIILELKQDQTLGAMYK